MKNKALLKVSFVALFCAIICISCFFRIPFGPVPIVLQNAICVLTGTILGGFLSCVPCALWLVSGLIGLPVYSGGTSGIGIWLGPTGGFLLGYVLGTLVAGLIAGRPRVLKSNNLEKKENKIYAINFIRVSLGILAGMIVLYIPGIIHFAHWAKIANKIPEGACAFSYAMKACVIPFLAGDAIKIVVCIPVALAIRPIVAQYLYSDTKKTENQNSEKI